MLPLTPRLRKALLYAESIRPHDVSCRDLLAGIMSLGSGVAVNLLKSKGFSEEIHPSGTSLPLVEDGRPVAYRPCALAMISDAITEAVRCSHGLVGVEHLLAGALISRCPELIDEFRGLGVDPEATIAELRAELERDP